MDIGSSTLVQSTLTENNGILGCIRRSDVVYGPNGVSMLSVRGEKGQEKEGLYRPWRQPRRPHWLD